MEDNALLLASEGDSTKMSVHNRPLAICIIILYSLLLSYTILNAILYLIMLRKYRFMPFLLLYMGMIALCSLIVAFFAECLTDGSAVNTNEVAWLRFELNVKAAAIIGVVGFTGLIADLVFMLKLITHQSKVMSEARRDMIY